MDKQKHLSFSSDKHNCPVSKKDIIESIFNSTPTTLTNQSYPLDSHSDHKKHPLSKHSKKKSQDLNITLTSSIVNTHHVPYMHESNSSTPLVPSNIFNSNNLSSNLKSDSKLENKSDSKFDSKLENKSDSKFDSKLENKSDSKFDSKLENKSDSKSDSKLENKSDSKFDSKLENKSDSKSDSKFDSKSDNKSDSKSDSKFDSKLEQLENNKLESRSEDNKLESRSEDNKLESRSEDNKLESRSEDKSDIQANLKNIYKTSTLMINPNRELFPELNLEEIKLNFKTLARIKENDKMYLRDSKFLEIDDSYVQSISRTVKSTFWNGYNREDIIDFLIHITEQTIKNSDKLIFTIKNYNKDYAIHNRESLKNNLMALLLDMDQAMLGINKLKITYYNDNSILTRLDIIIDKFDKKSREIKIFLQ